MLCPNKGAYFRSDNRHFVAGHDAFVDGPSPSPIKALHLIGERNARRRPREGHFERIALDPCCHRATDQQPDATIVSRGAEHDGRPVSGLLVPGLWPGLWIEVEPDDIAGIRDIAAPNHLKQFLADRSADV